MRVVVRVRVRVSVCRASHGCATATLAAFHWQVSVTIVRCCPRITSSAEIGLAMDYIIYKEAVAAFLARASRFGCPVVPNDGATDFAAMD